MATRPRTRLDPEVRRELILDAAERVLADRLPAEVTFEEIAEAADVSRGLVYNYFKDRTGLLVALALRTLARLDAELDALVDPTSAVEDQLEALGRAYARFTRLNADTWRLLARSGLLDHPSVLAARDRRVARLAALWGETSESRMAAWAISALYEAAVLSPLPDPLARDALPRFVDGVFGPVLHVAGSTHGTAARDADRPVQALRGGAEHRQG